MGAIVILKYYSMKRIASNIPKTLAINIKIGFVLLKLPKFLERKFVFYERLLLQVVSIGIKINHIWSYDNI